MNDLINRQAAIDVIEKLYLHQTNGETQTEEINRVAWRCALNCAEEMVRYLPSIQPEIIPKDKRGKWSDISGQAVLCSVCGRAQNYKQTKGWRYCPHCGSRNEH